MSDIIKLLPDSVANQIAAGEVIQRPASVVKELMENAIDAGATKVDVIILDAGRTSIQIVDNGCGMSETDARLSFERHATSKIRKADDLFNLNTMGFRGEALASIAAVAQVELKTRTANDGIGTMINISGSKVESQQPTACAVGSNFNIKNLFFNVPARRRFLKSNSTELNNIISTFERIVLVYPNVAFTLHSDGTLLYNLPSAGVRQRIIDVMGKKVNQTLLPLNVDTSLVKINGFIGKPESAKKKGASQFFFVNGRYMRHPYFHKAVMMAYERLLPVGEQPPYYIYMEINPRDIDVNIHPVKTEIKFENEQDVFQILMAGVREALGTFCEIPSLDFSSKDSLDIPAYNPDVKVRPPKTDYDPTYNPFQTSDFKKKTLSNWESLYDANVNADANDSLALPFDFPKHVDANNSTLDIDRSPQHYQYKGAYIITSVKSGLMIINQHRAHIRILYEKLIKRHDAEESMSQKVVFPDVIELSKKEELRLEKMLAELTSIGFEIQNLGGGSYCVSAIPVSLTDVNANILLRDALAEEETTLDLNDSSMLALRIAQSSAIPEGQVLNNAEMENIISSLFACDNVNYTPDGKRIFHLLPHADIENEF
ncbi:MAG: DNA mismatch repair endonuclease MutL [Prevotella sp.]|nr:DNA mismatch repair endonuclease MutL [Candidatus Equicola stercoris]